MAEQYPKRKLNEVNDEETSLAQCKSVLDISIMKLRFNSSPQRKTEPSLQKAVLIFNTLKDIENHLKSAGVTVPPVNSTNLVPTIQPNYLEGAMDAVPTYNSVNDNNSRQCLNFVEKTNNHASDDSNLRNLHISTNVVSPSVIEKGKKPHPNLNIKNSLEVMSDYCSKQLSNKRFKGESEIKTNNYLNSCALLANINDSSNDQSISTSSASTFTDSQLGSISNLLLDSLMHIDPVSHVTACTSVLDLNQSNPTGSVNFSGNNFESVGASGNVTNLIDHSLQPLAKSGALESGESETDSHRACDSVKTSCLFTLASTKNDVAFCTAENASNYFSYNNMDTDLLGDIDSNKFDFDLLLPTLSPNMKLTPLNPEDLVHSLPIEDTAFCSSVSTSNVSSMQNSRSEHLSDDIDHIMQILVGI